jgi:hypothetical protein
MTGEVSWINKEWHVSLTEHPARPFLMDVAKKCRRERVSWENLPTTLKLVDAQSMEYVIDFKKFVEGAPDHTTYVIDPSTLPHGKPEYYINEPNVEISEFYDKLMIFDIAGSLQLNLSKDIHLLWVIENIVDSLQSAGELSNWHFRYTMEGEKYWFNS